jgi:hypothetical protein
MPSPSVLWPGLWFRLSFLRVMFSFLHHSFVAIYLSLSLSLSFSLSLHLSPFVSCYIHLISSEDLMLHMGKKTSTYLLPTRVFTRHELDVYMWDCGS